MSVHEDFYNHTVHHHYGTIGNFIGNHALALVGHRQDETGRMFFLLQDWWKKKQFVEVDESYLNVSGATVYFIETPQTRVPPYFSTHAGHFFELEALDKPEGIAGEMLFSK